VKRGAIVGIVVGAVVLAAVAATGVWWLSSRPDTADAAALSYLRALEAGDADAVDAALAAPLDDAARAAFASAGVYLRDPRIESVDTTEGRAVVRAEADLGGTRHAIAVVLTARDGGWAVAPESLATLRVDTSPGDAAWVGDALLPADTDLDLPPARYVVEAAPRGILAGTQTADVIGGGEVLVVELDAALAPEATALAQEQLDAYVDACTVDASEVPENCGIRVPWAADLTALESIAFRIDERPEVTLSPDGTGFDATGGVIVATATGPSRSGGTASYTYRADDWALRGSVTFTGDEMVLSVR
jgi:hypothetical protein